MAQLNEREQRRLENMRQDLSDGSTVRDVTLAQQSLADTYRKDGAPATANEIMNALSHLTSTDSH